MIFKHEVVLKDPLENGYSLLKELIKEDLKLNKYNDELLEAFDVWLGGDPSGYCQCSGCAELINGVRYKHTVKDETTLYVEFNTDDAERYLRERDYNESY